jgi:hypothetical protein
MIKFHNVHILFEYKIRLLLYFMRRISNILSLGFNNSSAFNFGSNLEIKCLLNNSLSKKSSLLSIKTLVSFQIQKKKCSLSLVIKIIILYQRIFLI